MAAPTGFEPATSGLTNRRSHQLNYGALLHARRRGAVRGDPSGSARRSGIPSADRYRCSASTSRTLRRRGARFAQRFAEFLSRTAQVLQQSRVSPYRFAHEVRRRPFASLQGDWSHGGGATPLRVALAANARARFQTVENKKPLETRVSRGFSAHGGLRCRPPMYGRPTSPNRVRAASRSDRSRRRRSARVRCGGWRTCFCFVPGLLRDALVASKVAHYTPTQTRVKWSAQKTFHTPYSALRRMRRRRRRAQEGSARCRRADAIAHGARGDLQRGDFERRAAARGEAPKSARNRRGAHTTRLRARPRTRRRGRARERDDVRVREDLRQRCHVVPARNGTEQQHERPGGAVFGAQLPSVSTVYEAPSVGARADRRAGVAGPRARAQHREALAGLPRGCSRCGGTTPGPCTRARPAPRPLRATRRCALWIRSNVPPNTGTGP